MLRTHTPTFQSAQPLPVSNPVFYPIVRTLRQAIGQLDKANADVEALERLASFLGTLFVKHDITDTDEQVLAAAAKRRAKLKGESAGLYLGSFCVAVLRCGARMSTDV